MNIMLATVRSRIREIGIRKAVGATYREIQLQFLAEAILISLSGGVVGTLLGLALPLSVRFLFPAYTIPISPWFVVISLSTAMLVGILFGTLQQRAPRKWAGLNLLSTSSRHDPLNRTEMNAASQVAMISRAAAQPERIKSGNPTPRYALPISRSCGSFAI